MALMGELYGKMACRVPVYKDNSFFFASIEDYYQSALGEKELTIDDGDDQLFKIEWAEGQNPTQCVANAFIDYIASSNLGKNSEESEMVMMAHISEYMASAEAVVSNVFKQLNDNVIATSAATKLALPTNMN